MIRLVMIHPLTWCVFAIAIITGYFRDLILLFSLIFVHEMGHYVMARFFGWRVRRIVLLPFGGVAEVDEHGNRPFSEEFLVTIAGPFQHVWMIAVGYMLTAVGLWSTAFFDDFFTYNIMILGFNLLPIWPLDGGKLLFLFMAFLRPFKSAHLWLIVFSFTFLFFFTFICLVYYQFYLNLFILLLFFLIAHYREWRQHPYVFMRFLLERHGNQNQVIWKRKKLLEVERDSRVEQIFKRFYKGVHHEIVVCSLLTRVKAGEEELLDAYFIQKKVGNTLSDILRLK